jgi:hypothetical protein
MGMEECDPWRWQAYVRGQDGNINLVHGPKDFPDNFVFIPLSNNSARRYQRARELDSIVEVHEELVSRIWVGFSF